jgi:hypothetical protein
MSTTAVAVHVDNIHDQPVGDCTFAEIKSREFRIVPGEIPMACEYRNGHSTKAESFMRIRTRGSPSWPERMLRGRIHYCRLIETKSQNSACRSGAGHTFGTHRTQRLPVFARAHTSNAIEGEAKQRRVGIGGVDDVGR